MADVALERMRYARPKPHVSPRRRGPRAVGTGFVVIDQRTHTHPRLPPTREHGEVVCATGAFPTDRHPGQRPGVQSYERCASPL